LLRFSGEPLALQVRLLEKFSNNFVAEQLTKMLVAVLRRGAQRFDSGPEFLSALPIGGREGTLEDRMQNGSVQIRAKTGHLRRVAALSGIVPGPNGSTRAFSILVNGARGDAEGVDAAIDRFVERLGSAPVEPAAEAKSP
jgi:D-alanyl-D-alanine carboxypeptidase